MFIEFLKEFRKLSPAQQEIFLFCLEKNPNPQKRSGDISYISTCLGRPRKTVYSAFLAINANKTLSKLVRYTSRGITTPVFVRFDESHLYENLSDGEDA
jgi:hypothetical protein